MNRRQFLLHAGLASGAGSLVLPGLAQGAAAAAAPQGLLPVGAPGKRRTLILIELQGGNDGLNTLIPYADAHYARLRPNLAIPRTRVVQLDDKRGLHPALAGLLPIWRAHELALVEGVGYPEPNLSHFRSLDIWHTGSSASRYLRQGWLTRALAMRSGTSPAAAPERAVVFGSPDAGALARHRPVHAVADAPGTLPEDSFRHAVQASLRLLAATSAGNPAPAVIKLTLTGFDTHENQAVQHALALQRLSDGLVALRDGLRRQNAWQDTLVMTYSEFGRHPAENGAYGTDHGTAAAQLLMGGRVRGGFLGGAMRLDRLDGAGNPVPTVDFRAVYASVLTQWWATDPRGVLGGRFASLPLIRI